MTGNSLPTIRSGPGIASVVDRVLFAGLMGAVALVTIGALSAGARASEPVRWREPEQVLSERRTGIGVQVAAGARRYAVAVWESEPPQDAPDRSAAGDASGRARVVVSVRRPGSSTFGRPQPLSHRGAIGGSVGVADNGQTVVTWAGPAGRPRAVFATPRGGFSRPQALDDTKSFAPRLAVGADGTAVASWRTRRGRQIRAAVRPPGGRFGPPQIVATGPTVGSFSSVAASRNGRGVVAWTGICPEHDRQARHPARASVLRPDGSFGPAETIPRSKCPSRGHEVDVVMDADGGTVAVIDGALERGWVRASTRSPGGTFLPAERINPDHGGGYVSLTVSREGRALAVWNRLRGKGVIGGLRASVRAPGGTFRPPRRVAKGTVGVLAGNVDGQAVTVTQSLSSFRLRAAYQNAGRRFGSAETISPPLPRRVRTRFSASVGPGGRALVAWSRPRSGTADTRGVFIAERVPRR